MEEFCGLHSERHLGDRSQVKQTVWAAQFHSALHTFDPINGILMAPFGFERKSARVTRRRFSYFLR